jgi:NTP pyrophosphatase (non-canonical NTP hydrolase)
MKRMPSDRDINGWAYHIAGVIEEKGFYTPCSIGAEPPQEITECITDGDLMLGKLMLVTTEVSEAAEAVRLGDRANFEEEVADAMIRLLDICGRCGIDIEQAIADKMAVNKERPTRHGKQTRV